MPEISTPPKPDGKSSERIVPEADASKKKDVVFAPKHLQLLVSLPPTTPVQPVEPQVGDASPEGDVSPHNYNHSFIMKNLTVLLRIHSMVKWHHFLFPLK